MEYSIKKQMKSTSSLIEKNVIIIELLKMEIFYLSLNESEELLTESKLKMVQVTKTVRLDYLALIEKTQPRNFEALLSKFFVQNKGVQLKQMKSDFSRKDYYFIFSKVYKCHQYYRNSGNYNKQKIKQLRYRTQIEGPRVIFFKVQI